eukprot:COSAG06_NODE_919_length_11549_cov_28.666114_6_plen_214_part_00
MATQTRTQLQAKRLAGAAGELFKEGKVDEAVEKFSEALEIISSEDVVNEAGIKIKKGILLNRSAALIKIGEDEIVVEDCTEVLEMDPGNSKALFRRAMSLVNLDRWQEAVRRRPRMLQGPPLPAASRQPPSTHRPSPLTTRATGLCSYRMPKRPPRRKRAPGAWCRKSKRSSSRGRSPRATRRRPSLAPPARQSSSHRSSSSAACWHPHSAAC